MNHAAHAQHAGVHREHDTHAGHHTEDFLRKFWVVLLLTLPILAYSDIFTIATGIETPRFEGVEYVILALGSAVFFYGGWIFVKGAYGELRARLPGMMTLIALAITAAYSFSVFQVLRGSEETLFWELSTLIAIMLLGHWIEMRAVQGAKGALKELAKLLPDVAEVVRGEASRVVPLSELREGDIVIVKPGSKVPADGKVVEGESDVNEAIITGESKPVSKAEGSEVIAGSINGDGALKVKVTKIGEHTFLAGVMRLVAEAEASKSRLQMLSDRAAFYLTVIAVAAGGLTFVLWLFAQAGVVFATERLVAVLVIACPHALGLAVPLVASISTTMAARSGFLVKRRLALEAARNIDVVLFDKTGTLTKGEFGVVNIFGKDETLALAAAADERSEHPLGRAIVAHAREKNIRLPSLSSFSNLKGMGVRVVIEGKEVFVGSEKILRERNVAMPREHERKVRAHEKEGKTVIHVVRESELVGSIALADIIRSESREAVKSLRELGIKIAMVTGDSEDVAKWVSRELGIDQYFARVLPSEKVDKVKVLQKDGAKVAMVGDGVNDAPALTQADLGIAIGAGTNVAIESAGIILIKSDPRDIPKIIHLSKLTYSKMLQNLFWATGYNVVALPLAAGVLASYGILLEPALAAVFMSLSTVIVALNAILLRRQSL
ncbi:copper-translocating P-type ATPase [Candidatus Kaiserbacteria bacterium]|nr:copper-translocating P-type ATPase [Candidatus Kaiserbacteria bacterium]